MEQKLLVAQLVKKFPRLLRNSKFYFRVHVSQLQIHILDQIFSVLILYI